MCNAVMNMHEALTYFNTLQKPVNIKASASLIFIYGLSGTSSLHVAPAWCLVMVSFVSQLGDYFYNSIGVLQQADVEQATQNGKLAFSHLKHIMKRSYVAFFFLDSKPPQATYTGG